MADQALQTGAERGAFPLYGQIRLQENFHVAS
jgi:hypothetical protein